MKKRLITFCVCLLYPSSYVFAQEGNIGNNIVDEIDILKLVFYLGIIIALIYLLFYFLKKTNKYNSSSIYQTFGGLSLGQNKSIQVVEIGNKIYILGVGQEVSLIKVLEEKDDIEAIKNLSNSGNKESRNLIDRINSKYIKKNQNNNLNQFEKELAEKMEQLKDKRTFSVNKFLDDEERD